MRSTSKRSRTTEGANQSQGGEKKMGVFPSKIASKTRTTALSKQEQVNSAVAIQKNIKPDGKPLKIPKYPGKKLGETQTLPKVYKKKQSSIKQLKWGSLPYSCLATICSYACRTPLEVYQLSQVCSVWRSHLQSQGGCYMWNYFKGADAIQNFPQLKIYLRKQITEQQQKMAYQYEKHFTKLFNYGSTKQNIPNKLIENLNLEIDVTLNNKRFIQPFKLRTFNFSSYICFKIAQIQDYKYEFSTPHNFFKDKISLELVFRSKNFKVCHKIQRKYNPEDIVDGAIKQKAFNYYLDKNIVFTFFQGDNHFLYMFFQMSVLEIVNIFRSIIKSKYQGLLQKQMKKLPLYKQLCETQFEDFAQYVKFQADFEVHFSYHNSLKQIFTHCDTKVFPIDYDKKHAYFEVKVDDTFEKIATYKLDNKMGMSESIDDLYLLDFVLKDRDRFLIIFSGFIYARKATQKERQTLENYFDFEENEIKIIECKQDKYAVCFTIVEEKKKNLMKNVKFTLFA